MVGGQKQRKIIIIGKNHLTSKRVELQVPLCVSSGNTIVNVCKVHVNNIQFVPLFWNRNYDSSACHRFKTIYCLVNIHTLYWRSIHILLINFFNIFNNGILFVNLWLVNHFL